MPYLQTLLDPLESYAQTESQKAKLALAAWIGAWSEQASRLEYTIPALKVLESEPDPLHSELCCLVLENALVDGLYDFDPPRSITRSIPTEGLAGWLTQLTDMARRAAPSDSLLRARLDCAIADSSLLLSDPPEDVTAVYWDLVDRASTAGYLRAGGLVMSRCAYAYAVRGDLQNARRWWQRSILESCGEAVNYGVTSQVSAGSQGRPSASMTRVSKKCLPCFAAVER